MPRARLHVVRKGDHSLAIPKRAGVEQQERELELAATAIVEFVGPRLGQVQEEELVTEAGEEEDAMQNVRSVSTIATRC